MYGNNKLGKYRLLRKDRTAAAHLPPTAVASLKSIQAMLGRYSSVYLKPSHGTGGFGIFKLSRSKGRYLLKHGTHSRAYAKLEHAYGAFAKAKANKTYLVQMGIPLLSYKRRPFDLRVMVQRNPKGAWEATGIVGRVARPNKIVTNYHNGGKPMPVDVLLSQSIPPAGRARYKRRLMGLGLRVSRHLNRRFPQFRAYGIDIGIDRSLKPWIIEVNSRPDKSIFNALSDKRMYRKIMAYGRMPKAGAARARKARRVFSKRA
ncbi:YheC/YheD family protein [Cohnella hashimotonis]|uniref:YheC/YheD family protein n=1 Tax=Cohnella hashimotonis TaxID=2826895 RepID=A0ABT6TEI1_9BACL|nr:YheC/YheD family protein [Cohnella hashimotonis]MDI4645232.1 YheC/YheD family protein [Cohnella hashimotonis]